MQIALQLKLNRPFKYIRSKFCAQTAIQTRGIPNHIFLPDNRLLR